MRVHRLGVQKGALTNFGKDMTDSQIKKNACKNAYLGSIFIPEKYVFRVCFASPFTRMISTLKYKWPPPPPGIAQVRVALTVGCISALTPGSPGSNLNIDSYSPRTLRACCSQSEMTILKIRESSARALFLYNCTPAYFECLTAHAVLACASASHIFCSFATWVLIFCWQYLNDVLNHRLWNVFQSGGGQILKVQIGV